MNNEKQREIASRGGKAAHVKGTAHEWNHEEAMAAGRKGGERRGSRNQLSALEVSSIRDGREMAFGSLTQGGVSTSQAGPDALPMPPSFANNFLERAGSSLRAEHEKQRTRPTVAARITDYPDSLSYQNSLQNTKARNTTVPTGVA